jgi:hypothetical protein
VKYKNNVSMEKKKKIRKEKGKYEREIENESGK